MVTASAVLALVAAYWSWQWFAPLPESHALATVNVATHTESASGLFGTPERGGNKAAPTGIAIRLLGIVAATPGRRGYAVVQLEPRQILTVPIDVKLVVA